jgi:hypothetical protein
MMAQLSSVSLMEHEWAVKSVEAFHRELSDNWWHQHNKNPMNILRLYLYSNSHHTESWRQPSSSHSNCGFLQDLVKEVEVMGEEDSLHYMQGMNLPICRHRKYPVGQSIHQETKGCQR